MKFVHPFEDRHRLLPGNGIAVVQHVANRVHPALQVAGRQQLVDLQDLLHLAEGDHRLEVRLERLVEQHLPEIRGERRNPLARISAGELSEIL